ncbi:glycerol 3-phosphate dehydrogenase (NAD(P)+) [Sulfurivirga caldicuralii]|uniref:Glycerol-3-phosphate dehydrogenase [NAD(P)+] n=1 Tax=Sulfurivirga caldicuralii TaxID=364032 RepID=A0A1N6HIT7_9GAMM|nr:NAD(P)H-dependent glycerol-3-phosphate dehydrogenase [Sulfurivirga caldicuralii]SIO19653.1 glycerol 3-phosphate dehydrogenase (NAD(P)+) [Sulfurivirga caldicuralii]
MTRRLAVLGAGAWGTALAIHLARVGHRVCLWAHSTSHAEQLKLQRENTRYLPGVPFPPPLDSTADLEEALAEADGALIVVPSTAFAGLLERIPDQLLPAHLAWATKGFDPATRRMLHQVVEARWPAHPYAVVSGPTFAEEVAKGLPTAMVSASPRQDEVEWWARAFHHDRFRVYFQDDVVGVEVGGAYKNVMAIATGLSDGLGMGANARAALIARGLAEMIRFGTVLGARAETFMGLAGVGDLVLTCTDNQSRNRRFGLLLAQSSGDVVEVQRKIGQVVEGVRAADIIFALAQEKGLELPILEQVERVVSGKTTPQQAAEALFERDLKAERII